MLSTNPVVKSLGVGLLVNRSGGKAEFGVPHEKVQALLNLEVPTYKPEECPLCKDDVMS